MDQPQQWNGRGHFFGAEAMRRILVENARRKQSQKYGGGLRRVELDVADMAIQTPSADLLTLDEALTRLEPLLPKRNSETYPILEGGLSSFSSRSIVCDNC